MSDSLVAPPVQMSTPFTGTFLLEDGEALCTAIQSGDWIGGGMATFSAVMDAVSMAIDPIGSLIAMGLGWLMEHLEPLKGWLNMLTGDAGQVAGFAGTWSNVATHLEAAGVELQASLARLSDFQGAAGAAFAAFHAEAAEHLSASAQWAGAIGVGMELASTIVKIVHDFTRDAIATVVGSLASAAITTAITAGFGAPVAAAQVASKVATLAARVSKLITTLLRSIAKLSRYLDDLIALFGRLISVIRQAIRSLLGHGPSKPPSTPGTHGPDGTPDAPGAPHAPDSDPPGSTADPDVTPASPPGGGTPPGGTVPRPPDAPTVPRPEDVGIVVEPPRTPDPVDPLRSSDPSGDGWVRQPDHDPSPPDYGLPQADAPTDVPPRYEHPEHRIPPETIDPEVAALREHPEAPYGWDENGVPIRDSEAWAERYMHPDGPDGAPGQPRWPGNGGSVPGSIVDYTDASALRRDHPEVFELDRLGGPNGTNLTVEGTPFEQRAVTPGHLGYDYNRYGLPEELPVGIRVEVSIIDEAMGFPGGGTQVQIIRMDPVEGRVVLTVAEALKEGALIPR